MPLTTTEENQLRELLRRMNATQAGRAVDQLHEMTSHYSITSYIVRNGTGSSIARASRALVASDIAAAEVTGPDEGVKRPNNAINHLMTRDATRFEINRLTDTRITNSQNTANSAVTANAATLRLAQGTESRVRALELWKDLTVTPGLASSVRVAGGAYTTNPVIFIGSTNPAGTDIASRTHRFPQPLANDPMVFFSLVGDVNYPRYEWLRENGKVAGFIMFHSPTAGRWMALGTLA